MDYSYLADLNAVLNGLAFVFICTGLIAIKRGDEARHKRHMLTAVGISAVFLVSYLFYHANVGSVKFTKEGPIRIVYFAILISHIVLAALQVPMIVMTVLYGLREQREKHRKWAKVTAPVWLYVSLTGVVVYVMLYWL